MLQQFERYPLIWGVIGIACLVFSRISVAGLGAVEPLFMPGALDAVLLQPWTILSPVLVHYTVLHVVTNLYVWWLLARQIEAASRMELGVVAVLTAAVGNIAQWALVDPYFGGLSGVVYGLLGYLWITQRRGVRPYQVDPVLAVLLLLVLPVGASGMMGKFATYAHLGGLAAGLVAGVLVRGPEAPSNFSSSPTFKE